MLMTHTGHRPDTDASHERAVHNVIRAMHEHLDDTFSLDAMAEVAVMSPFHFNRTFREATGAPPCQFLSAVRLDQAKRLLLRTDLSVTDVCFEVGYNSLGTFIRRFTELVGVSPRRFRALGRAWGDAAPAPSRRVPSDKPQVALVRGHVTAPVDYHGPVFVALFADGVPQGRPVACTRVDAPGAYALPAPRPGRFQLFAMGLPHEAPAREYLLYDSALRAGGQVVQVQGSGSVAGLPDLHLHPPSVVDPPILMTLPAFIAARPA